MGDVQPRREASPRRHQAADQEEAEEQGPRDLAEEARLVPGGQHSEEDGQESASFDMDCRAVFKAVKSARENWKNGVSYSVFLCNLLDLRDQVEQI